MNAAENLEEIKALSLHYPRRQLSQQDFTRWLHDYANDIGRFRPMDVRLACAQWRQSDARRMPTPGELIAKIRSMIPADAAPRIIGPPPAPKYSAEHRAEMQRKLQELAEDLARSSAMRGQIERRAGETETEQAERLWPSHRVDRMRAAGRL